MEPLVLENVNLKLSVAFTMVDLELGLLRIDERSEIEWRVEKKMIYSIHLPHDVIISNLILIYDKDKKCYIQRELFRYDASR
jgi:hypothetical protein